jgi:hypothetical protein
MQNIKTAHLYSASNDNFVSYARIVNKSYTSVDTNSGEWREGCIQISSSILVVEEFFAKLNIVNAQLSLNKVSSTKLNRVYNKSFLEYFTKK